MSYKLFADNENTAFITRIISMGLFVLGFIMTVLSIVGHNTVLAVTSVTYGVMGLFSYIVLRKSGNIIVFFISSVILIYGLLFNYLITGGKEGFGILWVVIYPTLFIYLLSLVPYIFICVSVTLILIIAMWTPLNQFIYEFRPSFMVRFPLLIICEVSFSIAIKAIIEKTEKKRKNAVKELVALKEGLEDSVRARTREVIREKEKTNNLMLELAGSLAATIDAKDKYTSGHSKRVAEYSKKIFEKLGKSEEEQELIYLTALLHDIGKIGIPDGIINKTSRLTDEEFKIVKQHTTIGYDILHNIKSVPEIIIGVRWHHERYDGKGYPDGLNGNDIPEFAQIISVADSYDAMTSNRSYRSLMAQDFVRKQIEDGIGTQFAPLPAKAMLAIIDEDVDYILHE